MILTDAAMTGLNALQRGKKLMTAHCGFQLHHGVEKVRRAVGHAPCGGTVKR